MIVIAHYQASGTGEFIDAFFEIEGDELADKMRKKIHKELNKRHEWWGRVSYPYFYTLEEFLKIKVTKI